MRTRTLVVAGTAAAVLAAGSVSALAATRGAHHMGTWSSPMRGANGSVCTVPALPGSRVTVMLADMGAMMGGSSMMSGRNMMGGATSRMTIRPAIQRVSAGTVSITAFNHGTKVHELVVLPLSSGASAGSRTVGADDTVSEAGSLGEASKDCGSGSGDGIKAGSAGWLTLTLRPGRYELICNLPGHYAGGMYAELDVV